jgi:hypothetical protein
MEFRNLNWKATMLIWLMMVNGPNLERPSCFDVLSLELDLVSNLEIWLILVKYINIVLVSYLCLFKFGYKLCLNVC